MSQIPSHSEGIPASLKSIDLAKKEKSGTSSQEVGDSHRERRGIAREGGTVIESRS